MRHWLYFYMHIVFPLLGVFQQWQHSDLCRNHSIWHNCLMTNTILLISFKTYFGNFSTHGCLRFSVQIRSSWWKVTHNVRWCGRLAHSIAAYLYSHFTYVWFVQIDLDKQAEEGLDFRTFLCKLVCFTLQFLMNYPVQYCTQCLMPYRWMTLSLIGSCSTWGLTMAPHPTWRW